MVLHVMHDMHVTCERGYIMKLYIKYISRYTLPFFVAIGCVACEAVCDLLGPTIMARIINEGVQNSDLAHVTRWGLIMLLVTAIGAVMAVSRAIISSTVSQRIGADLRHDLFNKIIHSSVGSADQIESGSLITRMTNDTSQITQFINGVMRIFLKAPITCIGSIILATTLNPRMSLIIYGVVVVVATLIIISMKLSYPRFSRLQRAMDKVNSVMQEYLIGVRLVKAFGTYDEESKRFADANTTLMQRGVSAQLVITLTQPIMTLSVGLGSAMVIYVGSLLFNGNLAQAGDISAFTIYMAQILMSLLMITNIFNTFVRTKASTARINEVFDAEDDFQPSDKHSDTLDGSIAFDHVTFAYPSGSDVPALRDLSFRVEHGQSLAIIGPTGSGKSTIASLLLRFYDATAGSVCVGGRDVRSVGVDALRKNVAIVPQKPMLFGGSIAYNIRWGNADADDAALRDAAHAAEARFIDDMPDGFDSELGAGGVNISGGQKQRVSIARGIVKGAKVLILDDATSALDAVTEAKVRGTLMRMAGDVTVITITQRCTTAMYADNILVMENGRSVGFGTHTQLLDTCNVYREIYASQVDSNYANGGQIHG